MKKLLKKFISKDTINKIKSWKKYLDSLFVRGKRIEIKSNDVINTTIIENKKGHIFCGYFDISPDNPNNRNEIIAGMLPKNAICGKDNLTIALVNYKNNTIKEVSKTKAWNWQMGSRIRWSSQPNVIIYNDYIDNTYWTIYYDIKKNKIIKKIPYALYDINKEETFGLSINFSRLQRLRPGYGYANKPDNTKNIISPSDDGLFYIDLKKETCELLISYEKLATMMPEAKKGENYINHISISPDGKNAMFFYIWKTNVKPGWKATLWVINLKSKEVKCLERKDQVSHYDWKDNENILITGVNNGKFFYRIYNINNENKTDIENKNINGDGHPVYSRLFNGFYSDTYPNNKYKQRFFKYNNGVYTPLVDLYHDPRMNGEKRCDLHPHYFQNDEIVALDTTFRKNKRQILIVRLKDEQKK